MAGRATARRSKATASRVMQVRKRWLNTRETAAYLGCSQNFVAKLRDAGEIRFAMYNNRAVWHDLDSIENFLARHIVPNGYTPSQTFSQQELEEEAERQALHQLVK